MNMMQMMIGFFVNILPVVAAAYAYSGVRSLRHGGKNKFSFFPLLIFATAIYTFGYYLELNSQSLDMMIIVRYVEYFGVCLIPAFGMLFITQVTETNVSSTKLVVAVAVSIFIWALFLTNHLHGLFYESIELVKVFDYSACVTVKGPLYYVLLGYFLVFFIDAIARLSIAYKRTLSDNNKRSLLFLIVIFQIPWFNVAYILLGWDTYFDIVPLTIIVICTLFLINELTNDMLQLNLKKWKNTFFNYGQPAFYTDKNGDVLFYNILGNRLYMEKREELADIMRNFGEGDNKYLFMNIGGEIRWYDVKKSRFSNSKKHFSFIFNDTTDKKNSSIVAEAFFNTIADFIIIAAEDGTVLFVNSAVKNRLLSENEDYTKRSLYDFYPQDKRTGAKNLFQQLIDSNESVTMLPLVGKSGVIPVETRFWTGVWNGKAVIYSVSKDITKRKTLENALAQEKKLLETTLISVGDGVISTDNKGSVVFMNKVAELLTGRMQEESIGKNIDNVFSVVNEFSREKKEGILSKIIGERSNYNSGEKNDDFILVSKQGIERHIEMNAAPISQENGEIMGTVVVFRDFTDKRLRQKEIEYLSYHDQLTGLYNRRYYERIQTVMDNNKYLPLTLVMLDVNGLKLTNDAFGHKMGDLLLERTAHILKSLCGEQDIAARIGGDEFVLLLPNTDAVKADNHISNINRLIASEKIDSVILSLSMGYAVKTTLQESMNEIYKKAEDELYRHKLSESLSMRNRTLNLIMHTLYEKNNREMLHSIRVGELCQRIAIAFGMDKDDVNQVKTAGQMHDIGKIGIDERILNKNGALTAEERSQIERHSEIGYRILSSVSELSEVAEYVLAHHERWDGSGYPRKLSESAIPLKARIISIADVYDAVTNVRPYGKVLSSDEAAEEILKNSGTQFDPALVDVFIHKVLGK